MSRKDWRDFDWPLLLFALAAALFGVAVIYSATIHDPGLVHSFSFSNYPIRQVFYLSVGLVCFVLLTNANYQFFAKYAVWFYLAALGLLVAVEVLPERFSETVAGAKRWISLPYFQLQPSEIAKFALIVALARYFSDQQKKMKSLRVILTSLAIMAVPATLIFKEPDLGSALVLVAIWLGMLIAARPRWAYMGGGLLLALPTCYYAWQYALHDYQKVRLLSFLDLDKYKTDEAFNLIQSRISVSSGNLFGQGWLHGEQNQGGYLLVRYADFIYSVVCEEFGFIGAVALVILLYLIVWRCLSISLKARDEFGSYLCVGVATMLLTQIFVNVGMNVGLLPVTGIPLPFISYGGTSIIIVFVALALCQSVAIHRSSGVYDYMDYEQQKIVAPDYQPRPSRTPSARRR